MTNRLLATKFHIPPWRETTVSRPRLLERLNEGLREQRKLALLSAPAGYGKTTLVSEWLHTLEVADLQTSWLSLDEADNDLTRFLNYWLAAFGQADESISENLLPLMNLPQMPPLNKLLDELLNNLALRDTDLLLVMDDYHVISNNQIHETLEYFVEHQPAQVHLVMTTRQDPALPLARMRARRQMTEIRADELRFTPEEAQRFLSETMQLTLEAETAGVLEARTEGWAVGLQLAGLALQNMSDPQRFIETFRGSHRYVLDYLAEEVIRQQGEELRDFLTQTSILRRFNADLCRALTGRKDAGEMIAHLEKANLFLVPLDDERVWYRYHHLFADYLRTLLSGDEEFELYKKASAWHEDNDMNEEAVRYALASQDNAFSAEVISRTVAKPSTWSGGNLAMLKDWLDALPPETLHSRPRLSLNAARVYYLSGRFEYAAKMIAQAEEALEGMPETQEVEQMQALATLYRGSLAAVQGNFEQTVALTESALARLPAEHHLAQARAYFNLGLAHELAEKTGDAVQYYLQSSDEAREAGVDFLAVHALCSAAQLRMAQGSLQLVEEYCRTAIEMTGEERIPPEGLAFSILGAISLERNETETAETLLREGIALSRQGGLLDDVILGLSYLSRLYAVEGKAAEALNAFQEAHAIIRLFGVPRMTELANAYLARVQFTLGQMDAAAQWAERYQAGRSELREFEDLTLVRVLLAMGKLEEVSSILKPLLARAEEKGLNRTRIEILILLALYHQAENDANEAAERLSEAVRLAAPEGFTRLFLEDGTELVRLLPKVRQAAPVFVDAVLAETLGERDARDRLLEQLPEPLSEQETRVLELIVEGKSNADIAEELVITVGTAKWHVHNVLQKLGVKNRAQAIARARELGF